MNTTGWREEEEVGDGEGRGGKERVGRRRGEERKEGNRGRGKRREEEEGKENGEKTWSISTIYCLVYLSP